jgi:hypothetical protein
MGLRKLLDEWPLGFRNCGLFYTSFSVVQGTALILLKIQRVLLRRVPKLADWSFGFTGLVWCWVNQDSLPNYSSPVDKSTRLRRLR